MQLLHRNIIGVGKPFLILHGFLGMGDNWKTMAKRIANLGFEVHLIDQRNHGRSFHDDTFDYETLTEDLQYYIKHYQLEKVVLMGHSMGGKTAMLFAVTYPEQIEKLIVVDIAPKSYPVHHDFILKGLKALNFEQLKTRKEAEKVLEKYIPDFGIRQFLMKNLYWKNKGELALRINLDVLTDTIEEIGEALPAMTVFEGDTLFLSGEKSPYIKHTDLALIEAHFPNSKVVTIANSGHWLHAENPDDFFEAVASFI
jgi:pimeloyl-ACP methyl ester carboxylesterase